MYFVFWILIKFGFIWSYEGIFYLLKVFSKLIFLLSRLWSMYTFHLWSHLYIYTKGCKMSVPSSFLIHDYNFSRSCYFDRVLKSLLSCLYWYVVGAIYIFTQKVVKWVCLAHSDRWLLLLKILLFWLRFKSILSCLYCYVVGCVLIHGFFVFCSRSTYT